MPFRPIVPWLVLGTASLALAACGGGGSTSSAGGGIGGFGAPIGPAGEPSTSELKANWGISAIGAQTAYAKGAVGSGVRVAVIDTGVDTDHPDLAGRISPASIDIVTGRTGAIGDRSGHGTHVSGIVAAAANSRGTVGVAYGAEILAIRAESRSDPCNGLNCTFYDTVVAKAIDHAVAKGARVINLSLAGPGAISSALRKAIARAADAGVLVVAAAGNSGGRTEAPAAAAGDGFAKGLLLAVGATDRSDRLASFSNRPDDWATAGYFLSAPGVSILSTLPGGGYGRYSGTSMATPHVAGAAAVVKSAFPHLSMRQVADILLTSARDLGASGTDMTYGRGLLDLDRAMQPLGGVSFALGSSTDGPAIDASASTLRTSAVFGDALAGSIGTAMMLDAYGRPYLVDLDDMLRGSRPAADATTLVSALPGSELVSGGFATPAADFSWRLAATETDAGETSLETWRLSASFTDGGTLSLASGEPVATLDDDLAATFPYARAAFDGAGGLVTRARQLAWSAAPAPGFELGLAFAPDAEIAGVVDGTARVGGLRAGYAGARFALQAGLHGVIEDGSALASEGDGAFDLGGGRSVFASFGADLQADSRTRLFARATLGRSRVDGAAHALIRDWSTLATSSFAIGLVRESVFDEGDRLGLLFGQPLRVEGGSALVDAPVARTLDGEVLRERRRLGLEPSGRELDLQLTYGRPLAGGDFVGSVSLQHEPGHDAGAPPALAVGVRYSRRF